jgi:putative Mg2+ transporter-C (MgtC) family protein
MLLASVLAMDATQGGHLIRFSTFEQMALTSGVIGRLLTALLLGGLIGVDREYRHKAVGIRTTILIAFGAALFTFLSPIIAGDLSPNKGQIASNIVQGVGFLGAGLILHNRNRVTGLTSAATVFAVASIGMAAGGGLYVPATIATALVLFSLELLGFIETRANLKFFTRIYEARGKDLAAMETAILAAMDRSHQQLTDIEASSIGPMQRATFSVQASNRVHRALELSLRSDESLEELLTFRDWEDE